MQKKLDIIIPTKNRYNTLVPVVRAILSALESEDYRILIYDNTPKNPETPKPEIPDDHRVIYYHDPEDIDAVENFNRAIELANSKYTILIGDDDIVLPSIFEAISRMENFDFDCLIQNRPTYYWPNVSFDKEFKYFSPSSFHISKFISDTITELCPEKELSFCLEQGSIYLFKMPALYHGLLRTEFLKRVKEKYGSYIFGPSPDISLAFVIANLIPKYGIYGTPFSVAGASFNSAAGMGRRGQHSAELDKAPAWLPRAMLQNWDPAIPQIWNGFTVYAQSMHLVSQKVCRPININYQRLFRKMLSDNFFDIKYMTGKNKTKEKLLIKTIIIGFFIYFIRMIYMKLPKFFMNLFIKIHPAFKYNEFYPNVFSPADCISIARVHIRSFRRDDLPRVISSSCD